MAQVRDAADETRVSLHMGQLCPGDLLVEVQGQRVAGYTRGDCEEWLRLVTRNSNPVMIKTVQQGMDPVTQSMHVPMLKLMVLTVSSHKGLSQNGRSQNGRELTNHRIWWV